MSPRTASLLCYIPIVGWIPAVIVLASQRFRHEPNVRFHAFQGLYLFVAWLLVSWVLSPMFAVMSWTGVGPGHVMAGLLKAAIFVAWIFMLIKVSNDQSYRLPILGELAEKSVAEQR